MKVLALSTGMSKSFQKWSEMDLVHLNDDVLLLIFNYCSITDLKKLSTICKKFYNLIETYIFYKKSLDLLITGHRGNGINCQRTHQNISYSKRLQLHANWCQGKYQEFQFFYKQIWSPSLLVLDKDYLYYTRGGQIKSHKRCGNTIQVKPTLEIGKFYDPEILSFVKKNQRIFAGQSSGEAIIFSSENLDCQRLHEVNEAINSVDFHNTTFITTSKICTKIWNEEIEFGQSLLNEAVNIDESFHHLKLDKFGQKFVGGKFRDNSGNALRLIDLESCRLQTLGSKSTAIYQTLWKDENSILTANYDTTCRLFDLRTNCDVITWEDPFDSSVYSLDYDGLYGVLCGLKYHCRVNLYDLRNKKRPIQSYFPRLRNLIPTPAYSIVCDASQLFISTGNNIRLLNFDCDWAKSNDFSCYF